MWANRPVVRFKVVGTVKLLEGTVCNYESFFTWDRNIIKRFFCVQSFKCRAGGHHFPLVPFDGCDRYMARPAGSNVVDKLVCCHQDDIADDWPDRFLHLPGVKSYIMCREHMQSICTTDGDNLCNDSSADLAKGTRFPGLPTAISKFPHTAVCTPYGANLFQNSSSDLAEDTMFPGLLAFISKFPHTALIGYNYTVESGLSSWRWFCLGTVLTKRYILTVWKCIQDGPHPATNVKVGESRICPLDHCPDEYEEKTHEILIKNRQDSGGPAGPNDLALFQVKTNIRFNKFVRPACVFADLFTRQTQGWFARYGKPETYIRTKPGSRPRFMSPGEVLTVFKVKTFGEARILLSSTGLPYRKDISYEIRLGFDNNYYSTLIRNDGLSQIKSRRTPHILSSQQFRGFWVRNTAHEIGVGKEDSNSSIASYTDKSNDLNLFAMGIYTPNATGEWIFGDYRALSTLHEFELEVSYEDDCKPAQESNDSYFCATNVKEKFTPCEDDWGGGLHLTLDEFYCMWHVFAVFTKENPGHCSNDGKPALFKAVNTPGTLAWIEEVLYPNFDLGQIKLDEPLCTDPDVRTEGRCLNPF